MIYDFTISAEYISRVLIKAHDKESAKKLVWEMIETGEVSPLDNDDGDWNVICQNEGYDEDYSEDDIDATVDNYNEED